MSTFAYRAMRRDGVVERGSLDAPTRDGVARALGDRGLFPVEIEQRSERALGRRGMPTSELALGLRMLADLLESGLALTRALATVEQLAPDGWRRSLPSVRDAVREGKGLAAALEAAPVEIPPVVLGVIQAGEAGSGLASAARRAAEIMEEEAATRSAIRGALAYPLVLAAAGVASVGLLVGVVIPRFAAILTDLGQVLPASTQLVLGAAAVARAGFIPAFTLAAAGYVVWRRWVSTDSGRRRWHELLLHLPVIGAARRAAGVARACAALAALLDSGVPLATALVHAARAAADAALASRMFAARDAVVRGERVATALARHDALTPIALRLAHAGEESGRLATMIAHAARLEHERATRLVKGAVRLLEPMMILVFGGVTALIAAALLQAVYSVRPGA
jgi:general secretion pathway protein F